MLRIISGQFSRTLIEAPDVSSTRPTSDKVREAIVSIIRNDIEDKVVLDLFAGSGAFGLEMISNYALKVYFCDKNFKAIKTIKKNIDKLKVEKQCEVYFGDYLSFLKKYNFVKFDIVFLDPPYKDVDTYRKVVDYLILNQMIKKDTLIIKESNILLDDDERFSYHKHYSYGTIKVLVERNLL